ncbi:Proteasome subunit beta type-4 [Geranomyces variabilis]|uniref:Proteasome subunit beta n=1 Tax=Geranomyces variabilis TaxID=109894 RepID=A0AAD5TQZ7_9FUNG|nr:Proteasome subunit beta type-4 [Geranomyces variabilis]
MEALFGITGKGFVLTASDTTMARSIVIMKHGEDKSRVLNKNTLMMYTGEAGDTVQFAEYVQRNVQLYGIRNGVPLSAHATASYTRRELAKALRTRNPYHVNLLIAGTDPKTETPELYWLDHMASMVKMPFAAQGYASYFCMSTMDRYWKPDMTLEEAKALMQKCIDELKIRFIASLPQFTIKIVDKDGIRDVQL